MRATPSSKKSSSIKNSSFVCEKRVQRKKKAAETLHPDSNLGISLSCHPPRREAERTGYKLKVEMRAWRTKGYADLTNEKRGFSSRHITTEINRLFLCLPVCIPPKSKAL